MWPWNSGLPPDKGGRRFNSDPPDGIEQISDSVYVLHQPPGLPEIEIVFIHGLRLSDYKEAYWRTWIAGENDKDGKEICWPMAWLGEEFPKARILSLKYDSCILRTRTTGTMDSFLLGETLVQEMVEMANVGQQKNCPVVFVCHCIGGLIAKEIVIKAHRQFGAKYLKFLQNIRGFHFYATPHDGSRLADLVAQLPYTSGMLAFLRVMNKELIRLNDQFERIEREHYTGNWQFAVVAETKITTCYGFSAMVVEEASARHGYDKFFLSVGADHFGVCKPSDKASSSYLELKLFIRRVAVDNNDYLLKLPPFVVGMESRMEEVRRKLDRHSVVGLVGMGGVGKSTLSKYVFSAEKDHFERCCFLEDVKSHRDITVCQRQLFRDLIREQWDENEGVNFHLEKIRECIMSKKVLLVVDDVVDEMYMRALQVPAFNGRSGSRAIVTTRRRDILFHFVSWQTGIIDVDLLSEDEALQLFSFYAFSRVEESVRAQFDGQAEKIVKACGQLPLSLEVIGRFLRGKWKDKSCESIEETMKVWDEVLRRLKAAGSFDRNGEDMRIRARLKISFDNLSNREKSIFLDMVCILCRPSLRLKEGWWSKLLYRDTLERIWDSPIAIQELTDRSFIKWSGDGNTLVIHDLLQEMARGIVMNVKDGNERRIWDSDEGVEFLLQKRTVSKTLEGLCLAGVDESLPKFEKLKNHIVESLNMRDEPFDHLRLLNLLNCGDGVVQYLIRLCTGALRWIALNESHITESNIQDLKYLSGLRVLHMQGCKYLMTLPTSIDNLSLLMELDLSFCEGLKSLPKSIGGLQKLQVLKLYNCISLEELPTSIGNLFLLSTLDLSYCEKLKDLPGTIDGLRNLRILKLLQCSSLKTLPSSIGNLHVLTDLDISYCKNLTDLPKSISGMQKLKVLKLRGWYSLEKLPSSIGDLSRLIELDLSECYKLKSLPKNIGGMENLQVLKLSKCTSLETLPSSIHDLSLLMEVDVSDCQQSVLEIISSLNVLKLPASKEQQQVDKEQQKLLDRGQQKQVEMVDDEQQKQVEMVKEQPQLVNKEQQKQVERVKEQPEQEEGLVINRRVGDVEEERGRRPWSGSKHFYNFLVIFFILLEPLSNTVGFLTNHGRSVLGLLLQWIQISAGTSGQQVSSRYKCRVKSKDLILGRFLGQGCSGIFYETTWSGSHENTGRLARKLFPGVKGGVFESEVVRLFEITDDPNIAKTFCWTVDNRSCSLVIEYVSDNLSNVMRKRKESLRKEVASKKIAIGTRTAPFQFPEGMDIVYQIAMGVRHLHSQGIYHGDLKPNNVLIDWEEDRMLVKLADFGLNKTKRRTTLISQRTLCAQMIEWSAPEIVEDYIGSMREDLDYLGIELDVNASSVSYDKSRPEIAMEQADSYSFALICAYVLGGKVWDGNLSPNELRKQISSSRLRPKMPSECPDALASLISLCWDAEPKGRPTFSAICDRLEEIVKGQQREKKRNLTLREQPEETIRQRARGEASAAGGTYDA